MFASLTTRTGRALIAITIALAFAPTVASARLIDAVPTPVQDLRSPDARDAANRSQSPTSSLAGTTSPAGVGGALATERDYPSYPSPVREEAASRIEAGQDLRSPDTRDVAAGREYPPTPTVVSLKEITPAEPATGFDSASAAVGAATLCGILLMTAAAVIVTRRRAHRDQPVALG